MILILIFISDGVKVTVLIQEIRDMYFKHCFNRSYFGPFKLSIQWFNFAHFVQFITALFDVYVWTPKTIHKRQRVDADKFENG